MISDVLFKAAVKLYDSIGVGKKLERANSVVLILGGSSNGLGIELCTNLVIESNIHVINVDTKDMELVLNGKEAAFMDHYYSFIPCRDFAKADSVLESLRLVKELQLPITIFINNIQRGYETVFRKESVKADKAIFRLQEYVNANVTNIMAATKFFLKEIVPQTSELLGKVGNFYIVNLSTMLTLQVPKFALEYVSSKAALNQFHDGLTSELSLISTDKHIKTLLILLPYIDDGRKWEILCTDLSQQLVKCLKNGRRGTIVLRVSARAASKDFKFKPHDVCRYKFGKIMPNWSN